MCFRIGSVALYILLSTVAVPLFLLAQDPSLSPDENSRLFTEKHYVTSLNVAPSPSLTTPFDSDEEGDDMIPEQPLAVPSLSATPEWITGAKKVTYEPTGKIANVQFYIAEQHIKEQLDLIAELIEQQRVRVTAVSLVGKLKALTALDVRSAAKNVTKHGLEISLLSKPPFNAKYSPIVEIAYDSTRLVYEGDFDLRAMFDKHGRFLRPRW